MNIRAVNYSTIFTSAILIVLPLFLSACTKTNIKKEKEIVAYVNNEPIFTSELKREIARKAKTDPSFKLTPQAQYDQLESIIDRKLITQAAMEEGLARREKFENTIKSYWEQTLVRDFVDYKNTQAKDYIFVTEDEINKYYDNLSQRVTFKVLESREKNEIDKAYNKYLKDKDASGWQMIGPLGYEDINAVMFLTAFEMQKDEAKKFTDGFNYYLIQVVEKERVTVDPLEKLRPEIEARIIMLKERFLFEDWLKAARVSSRIKINKRLLQ